MVAHVAHNSGNNEWYTPLLFLDKARQVLGQIDLDPCSSLVAQESVKASKFYTKEDDGLSKEWFGNVWMNPPYSSPLIKEFCRKLKLDVEKGNVTSFITLTNNATETAWFADLISVSDVICFTHKRIRFLDEFGNLGKQPLQGQVFCYKGNNKDLFVEVFKNVGNCMVKHET